MYHKWQPYDVWFLRYEAWQIIFFVILDCFLPCYPPNNPKSQNFEKLKKTPGDIIILQKCTKNHDPILYCSLDMACNGFNYFSIWSIFCTFISLTAQKIKIFKKWKNPSRYHHFTIVYQKSWTYAILVLRSGVWWM